MNNKGTIKRYTLCKKETITKIFDAEIERENFIKNEINKINRNEKSSYFIYENEKSIIDKKPGLKLKIYRKLGERTTLKEIDALNIENQSKDLAIVYMQNGLRKLTLVTYSDIKYLDREYLTTRIFNLMKEKKIDINDINKLHNIAESRDLDTYIDKIRKQLDNCKLHGFNFDGVFYDIKSFVNRTYIDVKGNLQYRRYRDLALFISEIDNAYNLKEKNNEVKKDEEKQEVSKDINIPLQIGFPGFEDKTISPVRSKCSYWRRN